MAGYTTQSVLSFGCVDLSCHRFLKAAVEEYGMIVASGAPFRRFCAGNALHVFDGFSIELVIKRCEMVNGTSPLFVNIFVTFTTKRRIHKEIRRNRAADIGAGGGRPEWRSGSSAFLGHRDRRQSR